MKSGIFSRKGGSGSDPCRLIRIECTSGQVCKRDEDMILDVVRTGIKNYYEISEMNTLLYLQGCKYRIKTLGIDGGSYKVTVC